jgi:hypothetical protein
MALTLTWDRTAEPPRAQYDVQQGWTIPRTALISGVTATGAAFLTQTINDAVTAGLLPALGAPHLNITNAYCSGYEPEATGNPTVISVRVNYKQYPIGNDVTGVQSGDVPVLRFSATLGQVSTNKDSHGQLLVVGYTDPTGKVQEPQTGTISKMVPSLTIEVSTVCRGSPANLARKFLRKVNNAGWLVSPDDPEGAWMCVGVQAESRDFGATYAVTWQFTYREETWIDEVAWTRLDGKGPPVDAVIGNGLKKFWEYDRENFNEIGLV